MDCGFTVSKVWRPEVDARSNTPTCVFVCSYERENVLHAGLLPWTEAINKALKRSEEREENVTAVWDWLWY